MTHRAGDGLPPGFLFGEAPPVLRPAGSQPEEERILADIQAAEVQLRSDVAVPRGYFQYTPPVYKDIDFRLRHPDEWFNTELPPMLAAFDFLGAVQGRIFMDEAIGMTKQLGLLLYQRCADGTAAVLFEAPFVRWAQSDSLLQSVQAFREIYEDKDPNRLLRSDGEPFGTEASLAYCDGRPFMVVVRSRVSKKANGETEMTRLVEAVKVGTSTTVIDTVNQLSLREQLRVDHMLAELGADGQGSALVREHANRMTVQRDDDVKRLLDKYHAGDDGPGVKELLCTIAANLIAPAGASDKAGPVRMPDRKGKHQKR